MATKKTQNKSAKSTTQAKATEVKKPLISTARKIGIAVYFTFLGTLALAFGVSVWMADVFNEPTTVPPKTNDYTQNQVVENTNNTTDNTTTNNNQAPIVENYSNNSSNEITTPLENNSQNMQSFDQSYEFYNNSEPIMILKY